MKKSMRKIAAFLLLAIIVTMTASCGGAKDEESAEREKKASRERVRAEEDATEDASEEESVRVTLDDADGSAAEEEAVTDAAEGNPGDKADRLKERIAKEEEKSSAAEETVSFETEEEILDKYIEVQKSGCSKEEAAKIIGDEETLLAFGWPVDTKADDIGYIMYDVDADGREELIITYQGRIADIYAKYDGKFKRVLWGTSGAKIVIYPGGLIKASWPGTDGDTDESWYQYYPELGDYLAVFEKLGGEYYLFCGYDLSDQDMEEIKTSLAEGSGYPVWLGEWADMLSEKEYKELCPKSDPVDLMDPASLIDRDPILTKDQYLEFVKAPDGYANLRTGPGTEYEVITRMDNGEELEVYRISAESKAGKNWHKVTCYRDADNEDGYIWLTGWVAESQLE